MLRPRTQGNPDPPECGAARLGVAPQRETVWRGEGTIEGL